MDKINEQTNQMLFEVFGLCPEYQVVWTTSEWIEFYLPPPTYPDWRKINPYPMDYPEKVRQHLNEHSTQLPDGLHVSAYFAVVHQAKIIYLRIVKISGGDSAYTVYTNKK